MAILTVTTLADGGAGSGSLREMLMIANASLGVADTIVFKRP